MNKLMQLPKSFKYLKDDSLIKRLVYVRDTINRVPIGVVLITVDGYVGWSMLNVNSEDKWDRIFGIRKALFRARSKKSIKKIRSYIYERIDNQPVSNRKNRSLIVRFGWLYAILGQIVIGNNGGEKQNDR